MSLFPRVLSDGSLAQLQTGRGGVRLVTTRVYAAGKDNVLGDELTSAFTGGSINVDIDRDIKATCSLNWSGADIVGAFDWVAIFVETTEEDGAFDSEQVGLFRLQEPKQTLADPGVTVVGSGEDVTCLLRDSAVADTYNIPGGDIILADIMDLIASVGLTRFLFPVSVKTAPSGGYSYKPGTTKLAIVNDLLGKIGYYSLSAARDGSPISLPFRDLGQTEPTLVYTLGDDSLLVGPVTRTPSSTGLANIIIATANDPATASTLTAVARNDNPLSPTSTVNLGDLAQTLVINDAVDQEVLDARAQQALNAASITVSATVNVRLDPAMDAYGVARFVIPDNRPDLAQLSGTWLLNSYTHGLTPTSAVTQIQVNRAESGVGS